MKIGCETLVRTEKDGTDIYKNKKKFETLDDAIKACKHLNVQAHRINKVASYKCKYCFKYHIGRNGSVITDKYRKKLQVELHEPTQEEIQEKRKSIRASDLEHANFKIVGKIDLSKIPKK